MNLRVILCISCVVTGTFFGNPAYGQDNALNLRVITYNVQFLPGIAESNNERPEPEYRAKRIAEECAKFDIVAFQETFEARHRNAIKDGVKAAWGDEFYSVESPDEAGRLTNGGCLLMSRLPIMEQGAIVYKNYSSPKDYGFRADGFAAKGVIWARIAYSAEHKEKFIDVFVTHLEARADHLRPLQYVELASFIKAKSDPGQPMILMGDLNTAGMAAERANPDSQYSQLIKSLNVARPDGDMTDLWVKLMGDALGGTTHQESIEKGKRIDYIFLSNGTSGAQLTPRKVEVNTYPDPKVVALSDHNAVIAEIDWSVEK